jgi:hypothetical protein
MFYAVTAQNQDTFGDKRSLFDIPSSFTSGNLVYYCLQAEKTLTALLEPFLFLLCFPIAGTIALQSQLKLIQKSDAIFQRHDPNLGSSGVGSSSCGLAQSD